MLIDQDQDKFLEVKSKAESFYKTIGSVYCPYFKEKINFNAKGLDHIKMKSWNRARTQVDQFMRLKLIFLAPKLIKNSHTLQDYLMSQTFERKKINSRWEKILTTVEYFGFIAIVKGVRIKIIVKQIFGGEKYFWSIIPFWRMSKKSHKKLFDGNLEAD